MKRIVLSVCGLLALLAGTIIPFRMSSANDVTYASQALLPIAVSSPAVEANPVPGIIPDTSSTVAAPPADTAKLNVAASATDSPNASTAINSQDVQESQMTIKSKSYDQIISGQYIVINNLWGAPKSETLSGNIFQDQDGSFGWSWSRLSPMVNSGQTSIQPIYPSIRIGGNRWDRVKSAFFPVAVKDVNALSFSIAYNYLNIPTGSFDLSYDMFLSEPDQPDSSPQIAAEVMIWMQGTSKQPDKYYKGDVSDGTNTFALYSWTMPDGRQYYSFLLKGQPQYQAQYSINAKALLDQLHLDSSLLIHGVEFGNEVWNGSGQILITHFGINLNGNAL